MSANKFNAQPTTVDGIRFASKREARYYGMLKIRQNLGEIERLELQPKYEITVNGKRICTYIADFRFNDLTLKRRRVIDVKGAKTPLYRLKKKLVEALYPSVEVEEA